MNEQQKAPLSEQTAPQKVSRVARKLRLGTVATAMTVIVIVIILLLNVMMDAIETRFPLTVDLTADGTYSLSDNSVALAKGIDKEVEIVVFRGESYFSEPTQQYEALNTIMMQFHETLRSYKAESGGKVQYTFIDLDASPSMQEKYSKYGEVDADTVLFFCEDRVQQIKLSDLYTKYDNYITVDFSSEVERTVASKLNLVTSSNAKTVTILTGHGVLDVIVNAFTEMLSANACVVETVDITASDVPSAESSVLIIPGATTDYTVEEIAKLRSWLDNDGKRGVDLAVFVNSRVTLPNLYELLMDQYKIEVCNGVVYETALNNQYNNNPYIAYADVQATEFTQSLAGKRILQDHAAYMKLHATNSHDAVIYGEVLATYGKSAKIVPLLESDDEEAVSADAQPVDADSYPLATAVYVTHHDFDNDADRPIETHVMVFGDPLMPFVNAVSACNEDLFMTTFRSLTGLESVISIPSREMTQDVLDFGGSWVPVVLGIWVFTIGLPLMLIVVAIVVFVVRRRL